MDRSLCKNGHSRTPENSYICTQGWRKCRLCVRAGGARYRQKLRERAKTECNNQKLFPLEPLRPYLLVYANKHVTRVEGAHQGQFESGNGVIARKYQERYGGNLLSVKRRITRINAVQRLTAEFADELAILIGLHPVLIWGAEWFEWDAA